MKTIIADYNAATESGHLRLNCIASQRDVAEAQLHPGDWAWLSDSEVLVGAQLTIDDRYGLVGIPDWDTLVNLDEEGADDFDRVRAELNPLVTKQPSSMENEPRIFQLLTQMEHVAPPNFGDAERAFCRFRRALALRNMGKWGLATAGNEGSPSGPARRPNNGLRLPGPPSPGRFSIGRRGG